MVENVSKLGQTMYIYKIANEFWNSTVLQSQEIWSSFLKKKASDKQHMTEKYLLKLHLKLHRSIEYDKHCSNCNLEQRSHCS